MNDIDIPEMTEADFVERLQTYNQITERETELFVYHLMHRDLGAEYEAEQQLASDINELDPIDDPDWERKEQELKTAFARAYPHHSVQKRTVETTIRWLEDSEPKRRIPSAFLERLRMVEQDSRPGSL